MVAAVLMALTGGSAFGQTRLQGDTPQGEPPDTIGGLPPTRENVELVGKLRVDRPVRRRAAGADRRRGHQGQLRVPDSWQSPAPAEGQTSTCERGGVFIVDIKNPAAPGGRVHRLPARTYPGEGAQVFSAKTPAFEGDILGSNNEYCLTSGTGQDRRGGISLYDVTDPTHPTPLATNFGDTEPLDDFDPTAPSRTPSTTTTRSSSGRTTTARASTTTALRGRDRQRRGPVVDDDIDVFDITNPRTPGADPRVQRCATSLAGLRLRRPAVPARHDRQGDRRREDDAALLLGRRLREARRGGPDQPGLPRRHDFTSPDPLFPAFSPARATPTRRSSATTTASSWRPTRSSPRSGRGRRSRPAPAASTPPSCDGPAHPTSARSRAGAADTLHRPRRARPTRSAVRRRPIPCRRAGEGDQIAVIERGVCSLRARRSTAAEEAGYDGFIVYNDAGRDDGDPLVTDAASRRPTIPGRVPDARGRAEDLRPDRADPSPAVGTAGRDTTASIDFDGWGYAHLYDADDLAGDRPVRRGRGARRALRDRTSAT